MQVKLEFTDENSLTVEEVVKAAQRHYGKAVKVTVSPLSMLPHDMVYFALQQIVTHEQLGIFFNNKESYQTEITKLRSSVLYKISEILDTVIMDNEAKVS